jgi:hypothetical protein
MAKLTEEQRAAVISRGLKPTVIEAISDQAAVDKMFPPTSPATTVATGAVEAPRTVPDSEPISAPRQKPTVAPRATVSPTVQVVPAPVVRTAPPVPTTVDALPSSTATRLPVTTQSDLDRVRLQMIGSRSQGPVLSVAADREKEARDLGTAIAETQFTRGGSPDPVTALPSMIEDSFVGGVIDGMFPEGSARREIGEALLPRELATPADKNAAELFDRTATGLADQALRQEWSKPIYDGVREERLAKLDEQKGNNPFVISYKQQYLQHLDEKKDPESFVPTFTENKLSTIKSYGLRALERAMSNKAIGGAVIENPLAYVGRLTAAPVSAGVGVVEGIATDTSVVDAVASRVTEGMSMTGAGVSIADASSDAAGLSKDDPYRELNTYIGGGAGLLADFLLPVVPGVGTVTKSIKTAAAAAVTERALGAKTASVAAQAIKKGTLAGIREAVPFAPRLIAAEKADDVFGSSLGRFADSPVNRQNTIDFIDFSEELSTKGVLKDMKNATPDERRILIEQAYNSRRRNKSFAQFEKDIERTFDADVLYSPDFHRALSVDAPTIFTRATIDETLSVANRDKIAAGAAITSDELMSDALRFIEESGGTNIGLKAKDAPAYTRDVLNQATLIRFGVDPSVVRGGRTSPLRYVGKMDAAAKGVIARHYLLNYGNKKLTNVFFPTSTPAPKAGPTATTGVGRALEGASDKLMEAARGSTLLAEAFPNYVRLTRSSFVPEAGVESVVRRFAASPAGELRDLVVAARAEGSLDVVVPEALVDGILDMIAPASLRSRVSPGVSRANRMNKRQAVNELTRIFSQTDDGTYLLDVAGYNLIAEKAMDSLSSSSVGYKSIFDVDMDVKRLSGNSVAREAYINKVLTPKALNRSFIERGLVEGARKIGGDWLASSKRPTLSSEFSEAIGNKLSAIPEDFKTVYRTNRATLDAPDAWAKTVVDNYVRHLDSDTSLMQIEDAAKLITANHAQMFDDYVSMLFGGYESMVDAVNTTGKTKLLTDMPVLVGEMKQLTFLLSHHPDMVPFKSSFIEKASRGDMAGALLELRNAHAILQGRPLNFWFKNKATTTAMHEAALGTERLYGTKILTRPLELSGTTETRGLLEISDYSKDWTPMFLADDHIDLLSAQYLSRRQSAVVNETYNEWAALYPSLMPTSEAIAINVKSFDNLSRGLRKQDTFFQGVVRSFDAEGFRRPVVGEIRDGSATITPAIRSEVSSSAFNTKVDVTIDGTVYSLQRGEASTYLASTIYNDTMNAMDMNKAYMALIKDKMASLASPESLANSYTTYMLEVKKTVIDNTMMKAFGALEGEVEVALAIEKGIAKDSTEALRNSGLFHWTVDPADINVANDTYKLSAEGMEELREYVAALYDSMFVWSFAKERAAMFASADTYARTVAPQLTREGGRAFYDVLTASIENGLTANSRVLTQGPIEQATNIPLTLGSKDVVEKAMLQRGGIEQFTESMERMKVTGKGTRLPDPAIASTMDAAIKEGLAATKDLRMASGGQGARLMKVISEFTGTPSTFFEGGLTSFAKGSVLGGNILPNIKYLTNNFMTAPAIIYGTIGGGYLGSAMKGLAFLDAGVNDTMRVLVGSDRFFGGLTDVSALRGGGLADEVVVVSAPNGKVYTNYDLATLVSEGSIARGQASAELTSAVIKDLSSWANLNKSKSLAPDISGYSTIKNDGLGALMKDLLGMKNGRGMNVYQELGNMSDTMFRVGVLKKALSEGMEESQALAIARESLFDYNNMSTIERNVISKVFWFWNFRRNSYRNVLKTFLSNPTRFKNLYLANGYMDNMDRETNFATQDYVEYRPFIHLIENKENNTRYSLHGPATPMLQGTAEMLDYLSFIVPLLNDKKSVTEALTTSPLSTVAEMASPGIQTGIGLYLGVDTRRDGKDLGYYLDPRLMWYMQQNPATWEVFQSYVRVEAVSVEDRNPSQGSFQGEQWRIQKGDKDSVRNWFAIQQLLIYVGIQRNLREYAPLFAELSGKEGDASVNMGAGSTAQAVGTFVGVVTPVTMPTQEERIELNRRVLNEQFRSRTFKQDQ